MIIVFHYLNKFEGEYQAIQTHSEIYFHVKEKLIDDLGQVQVDCHIHSCTTYRIQICILLLRPPPSSDGQIIITVLA